MPIRPVRPLHQLQAQQGELVLPPGVVVCEVLVAKW